MVRWQEGELRGPDLHEIPVVLVRQRLTPGARRVFGVCLPNEQGVLLKVVHSYHEVCTRWSIVNVWEELFKASTNFMRRDD